MISLGAKSQMYLAYHIRRDIPLWCKCTLWRIRCTSNSRPDGTDSAPLGPTPSESGGRPGHAVRSRYVTRGPASAGPRE